MNYREQLLKQMQEHYQADRHLNDLQIDCLREFTDARKASVKRMKGINMTDDTIAVLNRITKTLDFKSVEVIDMAIWLLDDTLNSK